jgi:hypothetical protein
MDRDEVLAGEIVGHGAYICLRASSHTDPAALRAAPISALAERLGLRNEFAPGDTPPRESIAFLRRCDAARGEIADDGLLEAEAVVHVASSTPEPLDAFCREAARLLDPLARSRVLRGVVRPKNYTGAAMHNFAYARAVVQQPGTVMPNAFLVPLSKSAAWWAKDWMERHTYFLPRYDDQGRMTSEGHALAAAAGIPCLLRRTYRNEREPAPDAAYDFVTYFECADADIAAFHQVCANLRDVRKNPEWRFVREGPTWHGRRVAGWSDLFVGPEADRRGQAKTITR